MKLQKIMLCTAIALTAFGASLGLLEIGAYFRTMFEPMKVEFKPLEPVRPPVAAPQNLPNFPTPALTPAEESHPEQEIPDYDKTGYYYIVGDNPDGFRDFEDIFLSTIDYDEKLKKVVAAEPSGWVSTEISYKYSSVTLTEQNFSFVTESFAGVSYRFDGKFIEPETIEVKDKERGIYTEEIVLKGRLSKWRNGKKIVEAKVKMALTVGC